MSQISVSKNPNFPNNSYWGDHLYPREFLANLSDKLVRKNLVWFYSVLLLFLNYFSYQDQKSLLCHWIWWFNVYFIQIKGNTETLVSRSFQNSWVFATLDRTFQSPLLFCRLSSIFPFRNTPFSSLPSHLRWSHPVSSPYTSLKFNHVHPCSSLPFFTWISVEPIGLSESWFPQSHQTETQCLQLLGPKV